MSRPATSRVAMTLVELCVSLAIAAALVTSTLSATSAIARQDRVLESMYGTLTDRQLLHNALAMDILHSSSITELKNDNDKTCGIELKTNWSITGDSLDIKRSEVTVRYEIRTIADESWLCRIENFDSDNTESKNVRLVARDVDSIELPEQPDETVSKKGAIELEVSIKGTPAKILLYTN